ncbi:hypothetical protein PHYBLDRAFT_159888 [Phycomyces blakesleeanus NRRL 1555(-)]|uniref:Uncharacterized protein n=2 Tax=Phycomyces blakesleeanus TaxID=4837 RepID=A0A162NG63_PHYB8|nr:hypothetical protein PHYBLDRAFT_159888 [Phycomyces blakesleeanus NRRL 1555(-)]OAD69254.1 hypothetical protein PHYBLDRAFT_159888 [Phycomyces blakesleeanus NRRL 1555(-)]|eukprot:XP_018287294.1 hypothetical protein PHYBLDRAFT_159888 [Phycomyces blakesleeanus NRRL 1555(-)]
MIPDDERLTLKSLESNLTVKQPKPKHIEYEKKKQENDLAWRQQILHQSLKYCFEKIHRKQPSLSAKPTKQSTNTSATIQNSRISSSVGTAVGTATSNVDNIHIYESQIRVPLSASSSSCYTQGGGSDIGRDKAQYEAVVAQTMHRRPKGHDGRRRTRSDSTPVVNMNGNVVEDPLVVVVATSTENKEINQTKTSSLQIIREHHHNHNHNHNQHHHHRPSRSISPQTTTTSMSMTGTATIPQSARTPSLIYDPSSPSSIESTVDNDYLDGKQDTLLPFAENTS